MIPKNARPVAKPEKPEKLKKPKPDDPKPKPRDIQPRTGFGNWDVPQDVRIKSWSLKVGE